MYSYLRSHCIRTWNRGNGLRVDTTTSEIKQTGPSQVKAARRTMKVHHVLFFYFHQSPLTGVTVRGEGMGMDDCGESPLTCETKGPWQSPDDEITTGPGTGMRVMTDVPPVGRDDPFAPHREEKIPPKTKIKGWIFCLKPAVTESWKSVYYRGNAAVPNQRVSIPLGSRGREHDIMPRTPAARQKIQLPSQSGKTMNDILNPIKYVGTERRTSNFVSL